MEVLIQLLLDVLDGVIAVDEIFMGAMLLACVKNDWVGLCLVHEVAPEFVHRLESQVDFRQLLLNVR